MERNGDQREEVPEPASSDEQEVQQVGAGRIHYNRHTPEQVQELEKLFKETPHPNEKDRMELAKKLNIDVKKVKFWFQNRRTQQKTPLEDNQVMVLQETASNMTGSLIVYATVDIPTVTVVMKGEDTSSVGLLPSGLSIVPGYGEAGGATGGEHGSMVTLELQILLQDPANETEMFETISTLIDLVFLTIQGIKEIVRSSRQ